jgi:YqjK-like protein
VKSASERLEHRVRLLERAARQRANLGRAVQRCRTPLKLADYSYKGLSFLKRHPAAALGLLVVVLGRRRRLLQSGPGWVARTLVRSLVR